MSRLHLIELEDQPWCPAPVRDGGTDYLQFTEEVGNLLGPMAPKLAQVFQRTGTTQVIDLCSGGTGPWLPLLKDLETHGAKVEVLLTDLHPNEAAFERAQVRSGGRIRGLNQSVDATNTPKTLRGFRTLFNAFHHFRPEQGKAILADAVRRREGIAVVEAVERKALPLVSLLPSPLFVWLVTPFIRPFRWSRLLLTYVLPLIPLLVLFDGIVSCLRIYSPDELRALVAELGDAGYDWDIGQVKGKGPMHLTYLIGTPR